MKARGWTCRRQSAGTVCLHRNPPRTRKCGRCGKPRPPKRQPSHMRALEAPYELFVELNGGEFCGICRRAPKGRKLDRDHDHSGVGRPRGLLCVRCNRALPSWVDVEWLMCAVEYLRRTA